eukprot:11125985-Heterocapsa_arctica.AAC.1
MMTLSCLLNSSYRGSSFIQDKVRATSHGSCAMSLVLAAFVSVFWAPSCSGRSSPCSGRQSASSG